MVFMEFLSALLNSDSFVKQQNCLELGLGFRVRGLE